MSGTRAPADRTVIKVNGRPMEVALTAAAPGDVSGDAYLSFHINNEKRETYDTFRREGADDQYICDIGNSASKKFIIHLIQWATRDALMLMGEDGVRSAVIPASPLLARRLYIRDSMPGDAEMNLTELILRGIQGYAISVRNEALPNLVSDIVIAGGTDLYTKWTNKNWRVGSFVTHWNREHESTVVLKGGTFDLSWHALGSRIGIKAFRDGMASELGQKPTELQRTWLEMIGEEIVGTMKALRHYLNQDPSTNADTPIKRFYIVTFDAQTGEISTIGDSSRGGTLPKPEQLGSGEAAILIECYEVDGKIHVGVRTEIAIGDEPADPEVLKNILGITHFAPILPSENADARRPGKAVQLFTLDIDVDAKSANMIEAVRGISNLVTATEGTFIDWKGRRAIADYWSARTDAASSDDIVTFLSRRASGHTRYDFYIDESGSFIGGSAHEHGEEATLQTGFVTPDGTGARNVYFRILTPGDGVTLHVPISYEWHGEKEQAFDAFQRWYNSNKFVWARRSIATEDRLSEIMFPNMAPKERAVKFMRYLEKNPNDMKSVEAMFYTLNGSTEGSSRQVYDFHSLVKSIRACTAEGKDVGKRDEVEVAFLELLMRRVLGKEAVHRILRSETNTPLGSPGTPPTLSGGGGEQGQGNRLKGIFREPAKGAPDIADDESLHGAMEEDEIMAHAQDACSHAVTSAAIIVSSLSAAGK